MESITGFSERALSLSFAEQLAEHQAVFAGLPAFEGAIARAGQRLADVLAAGGRVFFCGNGGSAADAQHLASELTGRFMADRRPLAAIALSTDSSALTSIGNDYGFEQVFERQLRALGQRGDMLVAISTSGQSPNVLRAVQAAREIGVSVVGLLGRDGGAIAPLCDETLVVASRTTARIQEAHIFIGHALCVAIEQHLGLAAQAGPAVASSQRT